MQRIILKLSGEAMSDNGVGISMQKVNEIALEIKGRDILVNLNKDLKTELETYKKIAEKLATKLADWKFEEIICGQTDCKHIEVQNGGKCIGEKDCIIDWARKEVDKDDN